MIFRFISCWVLGVLLWSAGWARADEPKLTFYAPFDGTIDAKIAAPGGKPRYVGQPGGAEFAQGLVGKGLLAGKPGQEVVYDAKGNISPDQWTITFWVKGLPGARWNNKDAGFQQFWGLNGDDDEILWFYRYNDRTEPWLFYRPRKGQGNPRWLFAPPAPEEQWHCWAVSWRKGSEAYLYLDGQLAGQSPGVSPEPLRSFIIGGSQQGEANKIIDEFKIYDQAMSEAQIARQYYKEGNFALKPALTIPPARRKIVIDGKVEPGEWDGAAGFSGLIDAGSWTIEPPATWGKAAYDENHLYVLLHSDQPAKVKSSPDAAALHGLVKKDAVKHNDDALLKDDFFGIGLRPAEEKGKTYVLLVNGIDTILERIEPDGGGAGSDWNSQASVKSSVTMEGWTLEAAIPLKSLGMDHIAPGTIWRVNFARNWALLLQRRDVWSSGGGAGEQRLAFPSLEGTARFVGPTEPAVDLQQFEMSIAGRVEAALTAYNPDSRPHELTATLSAGNEAIRHEQISLKPGQSAPVKFDVTPKNAAGKLIAIDVREGKQVIARQSAPLIPQQVGQLALWSYPSTHQLRVGWTILSAPDPKALSLTADLKDQKGVTAAEKKIDSLTSSTGSAMMDIQSVAPGKYTLEIQVRDKNGVLQQKSIPFEKMPPPDWLGNTLGISDTPPPPWTDVKVDQAKDTVDVWGRTYDYGGGLLPRQIVNQGKEMLAGPMRLKVVAGATEDQNAAAKADSVKWTETTAVKAQSQRLQTVGPVHIQADTAVEFDGMAWMTLTVSPVNGQANISELTLEAPLKAQWAELIRPWDDYLLKRTGLLPDKGWRGRAMDMPWVGDGDGGIQFFQEDVAHWIGSKAMEIVPDGRGAMVMRIHLIDAPTTLQKPLTLALGWTVSPVKPAPKDSRDWRSVSPGSLLSDTAGKSELGAYLIQAAALNPNLKVYLPWWQGWWWLPPGYTGDPDYSGPTPVPARNGQEKAVMEYHGLKLFAAPYGRTTELGTANPWFAQFGDEWVDNTSKLTPDESIEPARRIATVSQAARSLRDFYAWGYSQLLDEGDVHAIYFDVSRPIMDTNIYHDAGVVEPDGSISPQLNILGTRKLFQRLYTLLKKKHPDGRLFYHMSGETMMPIYSFSDALVDGENYSGALDRKSNRGYEHVLSLDQFRTEYSAQNNLGPATVFLPQFDRSGAILPDEWKQLGYGHAEYVLGLSLAHDSTIWWTYFPTEVLARAYGALDKAGWNAQWTFVPYWRQEAFKLPQGVVASLYISPDQAKAIVVVMNVSDKDQSVDLQLSGLKGRTYMSASAVYPDEPVRLENNTVAGLTVKQNNFRAIRCSMQP